MKKSTTIFLLLILFINTLFSQNHTIEKINWEGVKRMNVKFMSNFIQSKTNNPLDSLQLENDIQALTRLNGISKATYLIKDGTTENSKEILFKIIENFSLIPNASLWTTDETPAAYRIGIYEFNFLGKNNAIGAFYQYNGVVSFGVQFSFPYLFSSRFGIESSIQKVGSIEPIFFEDKTAKYVYNNESIELLGIYQHDFKNIVKSGITIFNEKYDYVSGATSPNVPQQYEIDKILFKTIYQYNNLKYNYYLVKGIKNIANLQLVKQRKSLKDNFFIGWNDFHYFERLGKTGNWATRIRFGISSNKPSPFSPFSLDNNINVRGVGNIIDRGTGTFVINTEYRTTFFEKKWFVLQGNGFVDFGAWRKPGGTFNDFTKTENIKINPGIGLRLIHKTIFNAIFRIDYGFGIMPNSRSGLVFGIGQYF